MKDCGFEGLFQMESCLKIVEFAKKRSLKGEIVEKDYIFQPDL